MTKEAVSAGRRRFLTLGTTVVGGVGAGFWAWPFVASLAPSEKAKALGGPVTIDISKLEPGQLVQTAWRRQPIWVLKRTPEMIASLETIKGKLVDPDSKAPQQPDYVKPETRSIKPDILVLKGVCTHLGCSPKFRPEHPAPEIDAGWEGGFFCPCHGSKFDLSGRVFAGVPAPSNLIVPPHRYKNDTTIVIGEDQAETKVKTS